jgi:hypothetical protein
MVTLELYVAPNGLPVRTISILGGPGERPGSSEGIASETDIPALEVPVHVHAPPARLTISEARLKPLERKHIQQRVCGTLHVHGAVVHAASHVEVIRCRVKKRGVRPTVLR